MPPVIVTMRMVTLCQFKHFINMKEYIVSGFKWEMSGGTTVHYFDVYEAIDEAMSLEAARYFVSGNRNVETDRPPSLTGTTTDEDGYEIALYDNGGYEIGDYTTAGIVTKPICSDFEDGGAITFENNASFTLSSAASMGDVKVYGTLSNAGLEADTRSVPVSIYKVNDDDSVELVE